MKKHFVTKDMRRPKYYLEIEFAYGKDRMALSQRKYAFHLLQEIGLLRCKPKRTPIDQSDFWDNTSEVFTDVGWYRRLIRKLIYLTVTHRNIIMLWDYLVYA